MKLSDRDKKLLLILGILLVVVVPIAFGFRPLLEKTNDLKAKNEKLATRVDELEDLYNKKSYYETSMQTMKDTEKTILEGFDEGLDQENIIMFIRNHANQIPFTVTALNFGNAVSTVLRPMEFDAEGKMVEGLEFVEKQTTIEFDTTYAEFKTFLQAILKEEERMALVGVNAEYDDENGRLTGLFILEQYAFINADPERPYDKPEIPALEHGNADNGGIFGKFIEDEDIRTAVYGPDEEAEEEQGE